LCSVSTNVFLTLLSNSVLAGLGAFFFSTFAITLLGEIVPQAYFSRHALWMTARFLFELLPPSPVSHRQADGAVARLVAGKRGHHVSARARGSRIDPAQRQKRR
jgi:hypothetical protein